MKIHALIEWTAFRGDVRASSAADSLQYGKDESCDPSLEQSSQRIFFWIKNVVSCLLWNSLLDHRTHPIKKRLSREDCLSNEHLLERLKESRHFTLLKFFGL